MNTIIERIIKEAIAEQNVYPSRSLLAVLEDVCVRYQYPIKNVLIFIFLRKNRANTNPV
jgi:hypothetical protein